MANGMGRRGFSLSQPDAAFDVIAKTPARVHRFSPRRRSMKYSFSATTVLLCGSLAGHAYGQSLTLAPHVGAICVNLAVGSDRTQTRCSVIGVVFDIHSSVSYRCSATYIFTRNSNGANGELSFQKSCDKLVQSFKANGSYAFAVDDDTVSPSFEPGSETPKSGGSGIIAIDNNSKTVALCVVMPLETSLPPKCNSINLP